MRVLFASLAAAAMLFGQTAAASCPYPKQLIDLPDGRTASKDDMLVAQGAVKTYVAAMEAYLDCLEAESAAMGAEATEEHEVIRAKRHNAAIDAMDLVTGQFNEAVRQYKARD